MESEVLKTGMNLIMEKQIIPYLSEWLHLSINTRQKN